MKTSSKQAEKFISNNYKLAEQLDIYVWANHNRKIKTSDGWQPFHLDRDPYHYPFLYEMYKTMSLGDNLVIQKPTQVGATELALNAMFYFLDAKSEDVLYMLPTKGQLSDFAQNRIDTPVENSPYLGEMFSDINNVGLKKAGDNSLYLRGAQSRSALEEMPVGFIIRDELDSMDRENADFALKRLGASQTKWRLDLSHPTYPGAPIDKEYKNSSRGKWYIECPNCGEVQNLDWEENFYNRDGLGCRACSEDWDKEVLWGGEWEHDEPDNPTKGYKFTQLLSPTVEISDLKDEYEEAVSEGGHKLEQFHNTVLAESYAAEGTKLNRADVKELMIGSPMGNKTPESSVMGVDVGNWLHYWIQDGERVVKVGKTESFEMLKQPIREYNVERIVIDALPEKRKAREFIREIPIKGWLCMRSARLQSEKVEKEEVIKVNATEHHDKFMGQFNSESIILPSDLPDWAIEHLTAPTRVTKEDASGEIKATWNKGINHTWDAGAYAKEAQDRSGGYRQAII